MSDALPSSEEKRVNFATALLIALSVLDRVRHESWQCELIEAAKEATVQMHALCVTKERP